MLFFCSFCHFGHQSANKKRMTIGKSDLQFLNKRMTNHKFFGPEMIGQPVSNGLRISFELLRNGKPLGGCRICQWWMKEM